MIKHRLTTININNSDLPLHSLLVIEIHISEVTPIKVDKIVDRTKNAFLLNPNIFIRS